MKKNETVKTELWNRTAFQRTVNANIALSGTILTCAPIAAVIVLYSGVVSNVTPALFYCLGAFVLGLVYLMYSIYRMEAANKYYTKLVVIWEYNPNYIYRYKRYTAFSERPQKTINGIWLSLSFLVLALLLSLAPNATEIVIMLYFLTGLCALYAIAHLPIINVLFLKLKNLLFGSAQSVVLTRNGVYAFGDLVPFIRGNVTFCKAYKKQIGSFDVISFTYQRMRGYQILLREINIPIPPDTSEEEVNELLELYNSPDLFLDA